MNSYYRASQADYEKYKQRMLDNKFELIWSDILIQLSSDARREAKSSWYELVEVSEENVIEMQVPNASTQLRKELKKVGNRIQLI